MNRHAKRTRRIARVALLTALSLVLLYLAALSPVGQLGLVAVAGLIPAAAVIADGLRAGFFCYGSTSVLGLLLVPDKGAVLLYLLFFGLYPMIKSLIERLRKPILEWPLKLLFFYLILSVFWFGLNALFLPFLQMGTHTAWFVYLVSSVAFVIYDFGFSRLAGFYAARIDKAVRR